MRNKKFETFEQLKFALRCKFWRRDTGECGYEGECYCIGVLLENARLKKELASTWEQVIELAIPKEKDAAIASKPSRKRAHRTIKSPQIDSIKSAIKPLN